MYDKVYIDEGKLVSSQDEFLILRKYTYNILLLIKICFFCGGQVLNSKPCIYYALSISTKLSSYKYDSLR